MAACFDALDCPATVVYCVLVCGQYSSWRGRVKGANAALDTAFEQPLNDAFFTLEGEFYFECSRRGVARTSARSWLKSHDPTAVFASWEAGQCHHVDCTQGLGLSPDHGFLRAQGRTVSASH